MEMVETGSYWNNLTGKGQHWSLVELNGPGDVFLRGPDLTLVKIAEGERVRVTDEQLVAFTEGMDFRKSL